MSSPVLLTVIAGVAYLLAGRWIVATKGAQRAALFAILNLAAACVFLFPATGRRVAALFAVTYLGMAVMQYLALRLWSERRGWLPWLAFATPLAFLIAVRYIPAPWLEGYSALPQKAAAQEAQFAVGSYLVGLSYFAFRTSHLALEVRNGAVARPGLWEYLGFAFFAPTLLVGPINSYSNYQRAFGETDRPSIPVYTALLRLLIGAVKYRFLGPFFDQISYGGLLLDSHPHHWIDAPIAAVAYYLYLYCNFSGFCDVAIGAAGLMGIAVTENFDAPFIARNIREFWNRWHITLSHYMRDVVFTPLSRTLVRLVGQARAKHAIALAILVVFLLIGIWHGATWNYAAFGAIQAVGVAVNHYYTIFLKRRLGRRRFAAYMEHPGIRAVAISFTFVYVTASLFVFANSWDSMKTIFMELHG